MKHTILEEKGKYFQSQQVYSKQSAITKWLGETEILYTHMITTIWQKKRGTVTRA